ncbi:MAG: DUF2061 domain-containing protein [Bacteroidia bacterium]|nr:DUF2061 domain-containing protein [Bacteroidia bacterium]
MILDRILSKRLENKRVQGHVISATKALSWRILGTVDTWLISYVITGETTLAFSIASFEVITKTLLYYFHERAWEKVRDKIASKNNGID